MHITDPIADMLTRIRNANNAKHETVDVPASNMKKSIAQILLDEGYIKSFQIIDDGTQGVIRITLKYNAGKEKVISGLRRVSKPGLRVYAGADELPRVLRGLGTVSYTHLDVYKRQAVEEIFGVKVAKVNTMNVPGKAKRLGAARPGRTKDWKKAIVQLTEDSKTIEFFEGMV